MPALIYAFFAAIFSRIWTFVLFALPWIIEKIVIMLGISVVTYTAADVAFSSIESYAFSSFDDLPSEMYAIMIIADLDWAIKVIIAAMAGVLALKPAQSLLFKGGGAK